MPEIQFPCPEDILSMPKTSCGHFCSGCNKEVVDFRNTPNEKIQEHLQRSQGKTCGIFNSRQINRPANAFISALFRLAFTAVFFLGMDCTQLSAQETADSTSTTIVEKPVIIHGHLVDQESIPLVFAKVYTTFNGTVYGCLADVNGDYKLNLPATALGQPIELNIRQVGFAALVIKIDKLEENMLINAELNEPAMLTGIIVGYVQPIISMDPYEAGKTVITSEDIRHRAR